MERSIPVQNHQVIKLGTRVRAIRKEKRLSLEQLSAKSGVALATLSRMENGKGSGTFRTHQKLAEALGLSLSELYQNLQLDDAEAHLLEPQSDEVEIFTYEERASAILLAKQISTKQMLPQMIILEPGGKTAVEQYALGTERWLFGLEGGAQVTVGSKSYKLLEGGTLYFKGSLPHRLENPSNRKAKIISVTSPVVF